MTAPWRSALPVFAAAFLAAMDDACTVDSNAAGKGVYNPATRQYDGTPSNVYTGACLFRIAGEGSATYGEQQIETVDYDLLAYMKDAGCYSLSLGVESASQRILNVIGKKTTVEQSERLFNWVEKLDMNVVCGITFGHPTETYEEALHTLNFMKEHLSDNIHMTDPQPMRIYPGTQLEHFAIENNLLPEGFDWCVDYDYEPGLKRSTPYVPIIIQPQMGIPEFEALLAEFEKIGKSGSDMVLEKIDT